MGKAEWGSNLVCWWLGLYFCFVCCLDKASCTVCYWWLGDAESCIQVVSFVWVLTIWHSLGLVFWLSRVLDSVQGLLELTPQKDVLFIIGDWNAKVLSQETPGVTGKFGLGMRNEPGQRLIEFCQENTVVITTQEKTLHMDITRWSTPKSDWLYSLQPKMEQLYNSQQKQDWELTVAQIMNLLQNWDLNKVGKATRSFTYDRNQIPYNYTAEMTNRFKALNLVDRVP